MSAPKKENKIAIDSRFKGMFSDKQFNVVAKVNKYGQKINKKDEYALQNYYQKDSEESGSDESDKSDKLDESSAEDAKPKAKKVQSSSEDEDDIGKKYYNSDGKFDWQDNESSSSDSEDAEEKEDENQSEYSDDVSGVWSLGEEDADEEQADADEVEVGKRIAVTNLDWDSIGAVDLYSLFNSFCVGR